MYDLQLQKTLACSRGTKQPWRSHYNAFPSITSRTCTYLRAWQHQMTTIMQPFIAIPMRSATTDSKTPYNYAHTSTAKAAWSHRYNAAKKRQTDRSRTRRTQEVPFITACSHFTQKNAWFRAPASSPKQSPCNIHAAITDSKTPYNYAHTSTAKAAWSNFYNAAKKGKPTAAAPAAHRRYLSSPPAATLHGKIQGFVLRLPPQSKAHATFMQPFQCDLQPQIPKHPITTHTQAQPKQLEATVTMRPKKKANRPQPHPPHTGGTFHCRLQPLYTEKYKVSCSGFLPQHKAHATFMQPFHTICNLTTSRPHHFPSSPLPFVTTSLHSLLFFCDVLWHWTTLHWLILLWCICDVLSPLHHPSSMSSLTILFVRNSEDCFPTSFDWINVQ